MIENDLNIDLAAEIRNAIQRKQYEFSLKYYAGRVISNDDPEKIGRCQIRVYNIYGVEIPDEDLPWATPDFNFIGSGLGSFVVPTVGTLVNVYFENNDYYQPRYTTKVISKESLTNMSATYDTDYPDTMVFFETNNGDYFKINRATLEATFRHASGLLITCDKDGNLRIDNTATPGNINIKIAGDTTIETNGDTYIASNGKVTLHGNDSVILKTIGSSNWVPNALPNCAFTGLPHGGPALGIVGLKGA